MAQQQRSRNEDGPERSCIVSREVRAPHEMIRFVVGPDGVLVPDLKARLPGRGAWVTGEADVVREAVRRKAFARRLKTQVTVPPTLAEDVDRLLERDALQALSFANKAGEAVCGFTKVETAIGKGHVVMMLHAREAAADGVRKLEQAVRRRGDAAVERIIIAHAFAGDDLGLALGAPHVIHAALIAGPASTGFLARWRRLSCFRGPRPAESAGGAVRPSAPEADELHPSQRSASGHDG
ncbi:RNA-binding protein [Chelatococcus reniformis]|uniref:DNA-binding protein n=1 Tax=Chelatococcus reniformis TaxID=1494448 RepID=A0A916X904_9HYPH|nr:RNA-binding protein [Chelatococcus reniformis]GGC52203.1 DNA-binding protein [Chelatococcus reniformis]